MIIPAIDLQAGKSVRLYQGDFNKQTLINDDPAAQARELEAAGVKCLHLVDLDGAKKGVPQNQTTIAKIRAAFNGILEIGGGVRDLDRLSHYLELGIDRVIIGSAALLDPQFVKKALQQFGPQKVVIGVDGTAGYVAVNGWLENSKTKMSTLIQKMHVAGAQHFIVTDVARDGTLSGPNIKLLQALQTTFPKCNIIASGGIRNVVDVRELKHAGLQDMIVGKALFEGSLTLAEVAEVNEDAG
ncbi:1-(5-phosphoribosyl)-5-[(5-phosphoribosylamino)methylideneamino]imidazole-4-carboxamide isomerase [Liquorilactobacillus satsumensis]|uniref:1-(5-phosphoribosyl)-5-[(5- phosphoribosylamino)methylideneamino]imidazole-4- carboxamide isomerase n=1 Tax=Liquorilactobacillus satsumensis TaxID=259059 RepID=UPI0021C4150E|nr:1-(5-phosphoribosyl)-5-[(5-phosphoribosylamino)methylideneamino]imidazole-4-carboxamide isomerase [Liquorilactobacillus satsumensis]MCP9313234.1 1-(5-phosphoribosyl)-5-[(5-phosphoribosylamino)methylideneamino]imidazole-4-carboxamide isomerase [Liquorilactobacillus satsumensis]MCP9360405.1 1-(5-phosphoribosyl)-5-[(5-phosphoribosylamino)methylideneamino]imidazole-4-carboxamide isomerase [Liquorilactobacillus satsumensis]